MSTYTKANFDSILFADGSRKAISGVLFRNGETITTNGRVLMRIEAVGNGAESEDVKQEFHISAEDAADLSKLVSRFKKYDKPDAKNAVRIVRDEESSVTFDVADKKIEVKKADNGTFPPVETIYPKGKPQAVISFGLDLLSALVSFLSHHQPHKHKDGVVQFRIYGSDQSVLFQSHINNCQMASGLIMPIKMAEE